MKYFFKNTKISPVTLVEKDGFLKELIFAKCSIKNAKLEQTPLIKEAFVQLEEYFSASRKKFNLDFKLEGTPFQKEVWSALTTVPYGKTITYKELAASINHKGAYRAVGSANNKNPLPIIIPCHRVIGSNGKLIGYKGGLEIKEKLLKTEGIL